MFSNNNPNFYNSFNQGAGDPFQMQQMSAFQPQIRCFYINSAQEMQRIPANPNVLCIGINNNTQEMYVKRMNSMGIADIITYKEANTEQEKNLPTMILEKLCLIEQKLGDTNNDARISTKHDANDDARTVTEPSSNGII